MQYVFSVFASEKPHGTRLFTRLFVHAGRGFPRLSAGAVGTLLENAKLIFPMWAVKTASAAIFITSGTAGLIAVKSRLLLHEQFKSPLLAVCEIHSGCTSFPAGIKKRHNLFLSCGAVCRKGRYLSITPLLLGYSLVTCLPAVHKRDDFRVFACFLISPRFMRRRFYGPWSGRCQAERLRRPCLPDTARRASVRGLPCLRHKIF